MRLKALSEMRRVLTPGGRVALSVWTGPSPYFAAQTEGLARYVSAEAASTGAVAFYLGDAVELGGLLKGAGFRDVVVHLVRMTLRLPAPDEFLPGTCLLSRQPSSLPRPARKPVLR